MKPVEQTLKECGALLEGHFRLTSGRHSRQYLEKAEICADPLVTDDLCWEIANKVRSQFKIIIEVAVGLAHIGAILANRVAEHLGEFYQEKVFSVFTEKDEESNMIFKRGYARKISSKKVLIVDDVLTTGGSVGQVKEEIEKLSGFQSNAPYVKIIYLYSIQNPANVGFFCRLPNVTGRTRYIGFSTVSGG